jgi:nucleoside-diphosphate-sugar epimerase
LRKQYGQAGVVVADIKPEPEFLRELGPWRTLDTSYRKELQDVVSEEKIWQIYVLAEVLSARAEKNPVAAWNLNMQGLLNVLTVAKLERLEKIFWPSSIAVFGPSSPKGLCPQWAIMDRMELFRGTELQ